MDIANIGKKVDLSAGEWVDNIPDMPGVRFKVRSINYKPYRVASASIARSRSKQLRTDQGVVDFTVATGGPLAEHILTDWEGVTSGGEPLAFTPESAASVLTADDDHGIGAMFRRGVEYAAEQVAEKLAETTKEAAGN